MEFLDASDEEASPTNPKTREMLKNACHQIVSMLQAMETSDCLCQGSVTSITKRFSMACSMVYRLWGCMESMHAMGIIDSPELNSQKKSRRPCIYLKEFVQEGVKNELLRKRRTQRKLVTLMGVSKTTVHHRIVGSTIHMHYNSIKPILTEESKMARVEMALHYNHSSIKHYATMVT